MKNLTTHLATLLLGLALGVLAVLLLDSDDTAPTRIPDAPADAQQTEAPRERIVYRDRYTEREPKRHAAPAKAQSAQVSKARDVWSFELPALDDSHYSGQITGSVVSESGEPVADASVGITLLGEANWRGLSSELRDALSENDTERYLMLAAETAMRREHCVRQVLTDAEGKFVVDRLPTTGEFYVTAEKQGWVWNAKLSIDPQGSLRSGSRMVQSGDQLELVMLKLTEVIVHVEMEDNRPLPAQMQVAMGRPGQRWDYVGVETTFDWTADSRTVYLPPGEHEMRLNFPWEEKRKFTHPDEYKLVISPTQERMDWTIQLGEVTRLEVEVLVDHQALSLMPHSLELLLYRSELPKLADGTLDREHAIDRKNLRSFEKKLEPDRYFLVLSDQRLTEDGERKWDIKQEWAIDVSAGYNHFTADIRLHVPQLNRFSISFVTPDLTPVKQIRAYLIIESERLGELEYREITSIPTERQLDGSFYAKVPTLDAYQQHSPWDVQADSLKLVIDPQGYARKVLDFNLAQPENLVVALTAQHEVRLHLSAADEAKLKEIESIAKGFYIVEGDALPGLSARAAFSNGDVRIAHVKAGRHEVRSHVGWLGPFTIDVPEGGTDVTIELPEVVSISFLLQDAQGEPVRNRRISVRTTNAKGDEVYFGSLQTNSSGQTESFTAPARELKLKLSTTGEELTWDASDGGIVLWNIG